MKLYLDMCCFNRPFDDQSQLLVRLQTEAKLVVQEMIRRQEHSLIWSAVLDLENTDNPDDERRIAISQWKMLADIDLETTDAIEQTARQLTSIGVKAMDALHVATAKEAGADRFLTKDKGILNKMRLSTDLMVLDPIDSIRELEDVADEDRF